QNTSAASTDPLTVSVSDTDGTPTFTGGDTNSDGKLDKRSEERRAGKSTEPTQNAGTTKTNTFSATGTDDDDGTTPATASAQATISYTNVNPTISVTKVAAPTSVSEGGVSSHRVTYRYTVQNTSAASTDPLTVSVSDTDGTPTFTGGDTNSDGKLDK